MVRRHVIAALATGLRFGDEDAARRALGGVDWIVRGPARRRFERALIDAALATGAWATSGDPSATAHVLRVALLREHGGRGVVAPDAAGVERAVAALPPAPAPTTRPTLTAVAAAAGALLFTLALLTILVGPAPVDHAAYARPLPPPSAGAYRTGGRPLTDPALETLLRKDLADLLVATDRAVNRGDITDADRVGRHAALQAPAAIVAHGPALAGAWRAMLDALDHWAHLIPADPGWDRAVAELRAGARGVSDQLAALGLGYFVDGDVVLSRGLRHGIIYAYRVEHVAFVAAGGKSQRVLGLRRVDHVNLARTLLGMQSEDLGDPLLLLDQIDEHVATHLLAVLADDGRYPLGDARWRTGELGTELGIVTGAAIRTELYAALGADADAARTVGNLTSARGELLDRWREYLQLHDLTLRPVDTALLPSAYLPSLAPVLPSDQRAQMAALDAEMAEVGVPRIAARLHDLVAATVRRHEAQHAFDAARPAPLSQPTSLQMLVGPAELGDGVERRLARAARNELSAYVSQIASDPATPHLALWALARSAFDRGRWGRPEAYVATVVISGLARELDVPSAGVLVKDGKIDRDRLELLAVAVAGKTSDELRAAAGRLWASLFDEPYLAVVDVAPAGGATANVANAGTTAP